MARTMQRARDEMRPSRYGRRGRALTFAARAEWPRTAAAMANESVYRVETTAWLLYDGGM